MDWIQLFINLAVTGILLYVFQKIIDERAAKRLERFKAELQSTAFERETKYSKLHEIRAQSTAELYKKLVKVRRELGMLKLTLESDENKWNHGVKSSEYYEAIKEFLDFFDDNKIYLPEKLSNAIDDLTTRSIYAYIRISLYQKDLIEKVTKHVSTENDKEHDEHHLLETIKLLEGIDPIIKEIEFRGLLGS